MADASLRGAGNASDRWTIRTKRARRPWLSGGNRLVRRRQKLRLDQHRNDSTGAEREAAVAKSAHDAANLTAVRGDGEPGVVVGREDLVKNALGACVLGAGGFACHAVPQLVVLGEASFDLPAWEKIVDIGLVAAVVAGVGRDALAEELLDGRHEWIVVRQRKVRECDVRGAQAAGERRSVVGLRVRNVLIGDLALPEVVGDLRLPNAIGSEVGIFPGDSTVACQL